jgi:chromosome segregation and condensation protein ScpB
MGQAARLVGAGLALPLSFVRGVKRGQGKPSPYEMGDLFAQKTGIEGVAVQSRG